MYSYCEAKKKTFLHVFFNRKKDTFKTFGKCLQLVLPTVVHVQMKAADSETYSPDFEGSLKRDMYMYV